MPRLVAVAAAALCTSGHVVAQDPRDLARDILGGSRYQSELPGEADPARVETGTAGETAGERRWAPEVRSGGSPASLGYLPWIVLGAAVVVGAFLVVRSGIEAGRDVAVRGVDPDVPDSADPPPFDPGAEPLDDAERLAGEGRFGDAVRVLLHRTIAALRGRSGFAPAPWMTSREILRRAPLRSGARDGLRALVDAVEHSLFGRREPGPEDYARCAQAYRQLLADARGGSA